MTIKKEDIKWAMDNQQLQLLYGVVRGSIEEKAEDEKAVDEQLTGKIEEFKSNVISLINLILDNGISAKHITRFMIVLINKILISENEDALNKITISNINKNLNEIISKMITLHKLCREEAFKAAMCKIQAGFITDCIVSTESPVYNLRQQLQLWKLHVSNGADDPKFKLAETSVKKIEAEIDLVSNKTKEIEKFCKQYKVELAQKTEFKAR